MNGYARDVGSRWEAGDVTRHMSQAKVYVQSSLRPLPSFFFDGTFIAKGGGRNRVDSIKHETRYRYRGQGFPDLVHPLPPPSSLSLA